MKPPTSGKEVRHFIGVVNYYRDIWGVSSHTLLSLTNITPSKVRFKRNIKKQGAFGEINLVVARNNL